MSLTADEVAATAARAAVDAAMAVVLANAGELATGAIETLEAIVRNWLRPEVRVNAHTLEVADERHRKG